MLYAILCYHDEDTVGSWSKEQDAAVMKKLAVVQDRLTKQGRLGPVARLLPTTSATTLRKDDPPVVIAGPYAETKEQLLGFYLVDCNNLDEAAFELFSFLRRPRRIPDAARTQRRGPRGVRPRHRVGQYFGGSRPHPDASRPADARQPAARGEGGEVAAFLPCPSAGMGAVLPCGVTFDP